MCPLCYFNLRFAERIIPGMPCLIPVLILDVLLLIVLFRNRRRSD